MPRQQSVAGTNLTPEVLARALQRLVDEDTSAATPSTELTMRQPTTVLRKETPRRSEISDHHDRIRAENAARRTPYLATSATAAAGYLGWGLTELVGLAAGPGAELATTTGIGLTSLGAIAGARALLHNRIPAFWRRQSWAAGAGTAAWITAASAVGPANWTMTALLAGGAAATWASWIKQHSIPDVDPNAPQLPEASDETTSGDYGDTLAQRWSESVSRRGKALPGSMLTDRVDLSRAIRWTVRTPAGDASFDDVFGRRPRIAGALGVSAKNLIIEPHEDNEAWAYLTVIVRDLLSGGIPYRGPRYDNGVIPLGPFADGEGDMQFYAVEDIGVRNGLVTGEPGSGKSACLEAIGLGIKQSGVWHLLFGDGDPDGGSSPVLNDISDWAEAGPRQVLAQLEAIEAALEIRSLLKSTLTEGADGPVRITDPSQQSPLRKLLPTTTIPGLMWIIDELQRLSTDDWLKAQDFIPRLERVVRIGRKYGVAVVVGTQSLLAGDYGNSTVLRGYLMARNLFAFRNMNRSENAVVGGMAVTPGSLPPGGGYCFAIAGGRLSMGRVAWAPDLGEWATALPSCALDEDTALAMRDFQPAIEQSPSARFAAQVEKLHAWRRRKESGEPGDSPDATESAAVEVALPAFMQGLQIPSALSAQNVVALRPRPASSPAPESAQTAPDIEGLPTSQQEVLGALQVGHHRTGEIVAATGLKAPAVSKALGALADMGLARKIAHGQWEPAEAESQTG